MTGGPTRLALGLTFTLFAVAYALPGTASSSAQASDGAARNGAAPRPVVQPVTQSLAARYYVYGRYDVTLKGGSGPLLKGFVFGGTFTLPAGPDGSTATTPTDTPVGSGFWTGQVGVFEPGQQECRPMGGYDYPRGTFDIVASVDHGRLGVWIVPHPPANDPLLDVFDTRFSPLEAGGKHLDVPVEGGAFVWGGGVQPMKIECDGILPGSRGGFGVARLRGG